MRGFGDIVGPVLRRLPQAKPSIWLCVRGAHAKELTEWLGVMIEAWLCPATAFSTGDVRRSLCTLE